MLILSRKARQRIFIGEDIVLEVIRVDENQRVVLGIDAPGDVTILREELARASRKDPPCSNDS